MATIPHPDEPTLDIREQIARIDRMQAELQKTQAEISKWQSDAIRANLRDQAEIERWQADMAQSRARSQAEADKWQVDMAQARAQATKLEKDTQLAPWTVVFTGMGAAAAFFAAGVAFTKLFTG